MKICFNTVLTDIRGEKPIKDSIEIDAKVVRLGSITIEALMMPEQKETSGEEKIKRILLAAEIELAMDGNGILDIKKSEDVAMLKDLINRRWPGPLISGQALLLIEGESWPLYKKLENKVDNFAKGLSAEKEE